MYLMELRGALGSDKVSQVFGPGVNPRWLDFRSV